MELERITIDLNSSTKDSNWDNKGDINHMSYIIISICVVVVVAIVIRTVFMKKKTETPMQLASSKDTTSSETIPIENASQELLIRIETLPVEAIPDKCRLVEIADSKLLARVNALIPGMAQAAIATNNAAEAVQANGQILYRAIIPAGVQLSDSKAMDGAVRGFYRGANGIAGQANLVAVESNKNAAIVANSTAAAMDVASMVVGQYYMSQINAELEEISDSISKISDFQDNEYRSRVGSLIAHVKGIADFQVEILENSELRVSKINQLNHLEEECTQLLGQAILTLDGYPQKINLDYDAYEKELKSAQKWYMYQKSLLDVLYKISDLKYVLHLGTVSKKQCISMVQTYLQKAADTQDRLRNWHQDITKRLNISADEGKRKRDGLDGVAHFIPGLFNEKHHYKPIEQSVANMITTQTSVQISDQQNIADLYAEDVQLIVKNGKIYYLPENNDE